MSYSSNSPHITDQWRSRRALNCQCSHVQTLLVAVTCHHLSKNHDSTNNNSWGFLQHLILPNLIHVRLYKDPLFPISAKTIFCICITDLSFTKNAITRFDPLSYYMTRDRMETCPYCYAKFQGLWSIRTTERRGRSRRRLSTNKFVAG